MAPSKAVRCNFTLFLGLPSRDLLVVYKTVCREFLYSPLKGEVKPGCFVIFLVTRDFGLPPQQGSVHREYVFWVGECYNAHRLMLNKLASCWLFEMCQCASRAQKVSISAEKELGALRQPTFFKFHPFKLTAVQRTLEKYVQGAKHVHLFNFRGLEKTVKPERGRVSFPVSIAQGLTAGNLEETHLTCRGWTKSCTK